MTASHRLNIALAKNHNQPLEEDFEAHQDMPLHENTLLLHPSQTGTEQMMTSFATLAIGQAPDGEIMPLLNEYIPAENLTHVGLLDGLSRQEIEQHYAPTIDEPVVISRLQDGSRVVLSSQRVEHALQEKIDWMAEKGCEVLLLMCGGEFSGLHSQSVMLINPDRLVPPLIEGIVGTNQVGIIVSDTEQMEQQVDKWKNLAKRPRFAIASPYLFNGRAVDEGGADEKRLLDAALSLKAQGAEVVVLDCIGYQTQHGEMLEELLQLPVLLSNTLVARLAAELII